MEVIAAQVVAVLARYAVEGGKKLLQDEGPSAAKAAGRLFDAVLERLRFDVGEARDLEEFEKRPEVYEKPVEAALDRHLKSDPAFAEQIQGLLAAVEAVAPGISIVQTGSGAVATTGGIAAGEGGAAAGPGGTAVVGTIGSPLPDPQREDPKE